MEEILMRKQTCVANTTSSTALAIHKNSQTISKVKPKIRIIHIFAPEIIKTDVANFRELVQRLTGKPTETTTKKKKLPRIPRKGGYQEPDIIRGLPNKPLNMAKKVEFRERIKGEEGMSWMGDYHNSGGYLGGFQDLDGFMQELHGYPLIPLDSSSHMINAFGESQFA